MEFRTSSEANPVAPASDGQGALGAPCVADGPRVLRTVLVAPSRYDRLGVAVFRLGISPNGALGALAGLSEDYNRRHLGHSCIEYDFFDEHVREPVTVALLRRWKAEAARDGAVFVLMLCGVQTATWPRARDIALMARREGIEVLAGGVHLSAHAPSVDFLLACDAHVAIGEVEPIWDDLVADALAGRLAPVYRLAEGQGLRVKSATSYITAPDIRDAPFPHVPPSERRRYVNPRQVFIDSSRGCPFLCTFCVVKNVFGRSVRARDPQGLVAWMVRQARESGVRSFSFTDDNFVRSPVHREVLAGIAAARARGLSFTISLILDVEATCYAADDTPRGEATREFLGLCRDAGVAHVYIGLESTSDAVLQEMRKSVNRDRDQIHGRVGEDDGAEQARRRLIERYRSAVRAWHDIGVSVECGYIVGFDADRAGVGLQAARDLAEIGVDIATFFLLAPLPGSEDYAEAVRTGSLLEPDFNEYFQHPMLAHPTMSAPELAAELSAAVRETWKWRRVLRRIAGGVLGLGRPRARTPWTYLKRQLGYKVMLMSGLHTYVEGGLLRRPAVDGARREAIGDREARAFWLGSGASAQGEARTIPMRDEASIGSLPILVGQDARRGAHPTTRTAA